MEVERIGSDSENVVLDVDLEGEKPVPEEGAGDAAAASTGHLRRKNKKYMRTNSKDGVSTTATPIPKYRSWKNSRRSRNGHGRGLPKKGNHKLFNLLESNRCLPMKVPEAFLFEWSCIYLRNLCLLRIFIRST